MTPNIRIGTLQDKKFWLFLRQQLWPNCEEKKHLDEINSYISSSEKCAFFAYDEDGTAIGFCECTLRHDYVEGSSNSPTVYLEGIFVSETFRRHGIAKKLIEHAENWARTLGYNEIGSDTEINNLAGIDMHINLGFTEKNRIVHFIKTINKISEGFK